MAFTIYVHNDGGTAQYTVTQHLDHGQKKIVFDDTLTPDATVPVEAYETEEDGNSKGVFDWSSPQQAGTISNDVWADGTLNVGS